MVSPPDHSGRGSRRFNTQPPEGGWRSRLSRVAGRICFNTQPPEGGWAARHTLTLSSIGCFNTQPPEGGWQSPATQWIC